MRATAPSGSARFEGVTAWSGELGYGVRAPEAAQDADHDIAHDADLDADQDADQDAAHDAHQDGAS
jgi:hypothetical protein